MDPISAVVGVVIFLVGVGAGRAFRRGQSPTGNQPICGCVHHLSMHDPETGHCHGQCEVTIKPPKGAYEYTEWRPCTCRRYIGPEPLADVWAAPLAIDHNKPS